MKKLSLSILAMLFAFGSSTAFSAKCKEIKDEAACSGDTACHWKALKGGKGKCFNAPKEKKNEKHDDKKHHDEHAAPVAPAAMAPMAAPTAAPVAPAATPAQ